jgi:hypothetical protein
VYTFACIKNWLYWRRDLIIPGPARVWRRKPQLGRKTVTQLSALHLNSNCRNVQSQACSGQSTFQWSSGGKDRQVIHWQTEQLTARLAVSRWIALSANSRDRENAAWPQYLDAVYKHC